MQSKTARLARTFQIKLKCLSTFKIVGDFISLLREKTSWRRGAPTGEIIGLTKTPVHCVTDQPSESLQSLFPH